VLLLVLVHAKHYLQKRSMDVVTAIAYRVDGELAGRRDDVHPAPTCCRGATCLAGRRGRVAVLTYIRAESYFPMFLQLECTLVSSLSA
jgi:hypothetical protein